MKQQKQKHPNFRILYNSRYFQISQPEIGHISITFKDQSQLFQYICTQELKQVSYKTVFTALRQQEQQIVGAQFIKISNNQYRLKVKVSYEFLRDIQQVFIFKRGRKLTQQQINCFKIKKQNNNILTSLKSQLHDVNCLSILSARINNFPKKIHQIYIKIPFSTTVISLSLNFHKPQSDLMNIQFYNIDDLAKFKIPTNTFPQQGIFLQGNTIQVRLIADKKNFQQGCITIEGDFDYCDYMITFQSAHLSNAINYRQRFKQGLAITVIASVFVLFYRYMQNSPFVEV